MALLQRRPVRATARRQADAQTIGMKLPGVQGGQQRARRRAGLVLGRARQRAGRAFSSGSACVPEFVLRKCCAFFFLRDGENGTLLFFFACSLCAFCTGNFGENLPSEGVICKHADIAVSKYVSGSGSLCCVWGTPPPFGADRGGLTSGIARQSDRQRGMIL